MTEEKREQDSPLVKSPAVEIETINDLLYFIRGLDPEMKVYLTGANTIYRVKGRVGILEGLRLEGFPPGEESRKQGVFLSPL